MIELLWVNMHIYFPIGIVLIVFFLIDYLILNRKRLNHQHTSILVLVLLLSVLVTLLNPNGLKGALYPFTVFQNYGYSIEENQNIFFLWNFVHKQSILFFFITVPLLFAALFLNFKRVLPVDWLISVSFTILAILSIRNFPLFVFATFIPFVRYTSGLKFFALKKHLKIVLLILLIFLALFETQQIYIKKGFGLGVETGAKNGADFFIKENLKGPIFNNFDIGSYLDYRFYPKERVFVDGRPEAYPATFFLQDYIPMQVEESKFDNQDQKYKFNTIFFSHTDQTPWGENFIRQITKNSKWKLVYLDDFAVIWTKDPPAGEAGKNIKSVIKTNYSNMRSLIQLSRFFQIASLEDQEINIYQEILNIDPTFCPALYNLALKLQSRNDPSFPIFINKFNNNCQ